LFLGHFEHESGLVRFSKSPSNSAYKPVVSRPLDMNEIQAAVHDTHESDMGDASFPSDWQIWLDDGFLVCDKYTRNPDEVRFVNRLVERTGCEIVDAIARQSISLEEWSALAHKASSIARNR
jgi:hypothetical protein